MTSTASKNVARSREYYARVNEKCAYAEANQTPKAWAEVLSVIDPSMHGCADLIGIQNKALAVMLRFM